MIKNIALGLVSLVVSFIAVNSTNVLIANINHCSVGFEVPTVSNCPLLRGSQVLILWFIYLIVVFVILKLVMKLFRN